MRKFLKNKKGFTLVELMMVIAVIGILAIVLIPKMGGVKNDAKTAGVDANMRVVKSSAIAIIDKYDDDDSGAAALEAKLEKRLSSLVNPVTNGTGVKKITAIDDDSDKAVVYLDTNPEADDSWADDSGKKGCIGLSVYDDPTNGLTVSLTPFDADGSIGIAETITKDSN